MSLLNIPYETKYEQGSISAPGSLFTINPITVATKRRRIVVERLVVSCLKPSDFQIEQNGNVWFPRQYIINAWDSGFDFDLQLPEGAILSVVGLVIPSTFTGKLWYRIQ